jgi:two-component system cell cycle sensor histidine kinase/response regulator CckA
MTRTLSNDLGNQKKSQTSLLDHSARLAQVGSFRINLADDTVEWSDEVYRIFGVSKKTYTPTVEGNRERTHKEDHSTCAEAMRRAVDTVTIGRCQQRVIRPDGSVRQAVLFFEGEYDEEGNATHIVGAIQDITELKQAEIERNKLEAKLQQAQKLESLGVLAGGIAHDFNNLLMGILGNADLALMDLAPEAPARQSLAAIEDAAKRAAELARQMLAYSGRGKFTVKRLHLHALIQETAHLLRSSISKKAVLKLDLNKEAPPVEADAAQIRQVLMNLVANASEAIDEVSGVITIRTGALDCDRAYLGGTYLEHDLGEGTYSYIEVTDTGVGMSKETLPKIFDPFFTTKFTGRGLGLAAVLGIVRGHKGGVKVYSEEGKGTTVKVLFPAVVGPITSSDPLMDYQVNEQFRERRVLLVDDEETVRSVGKAMLKRLGCHVTVAEDGREALKIYQATPDYFDCVILDLTMPHMDGEECYRELRKVKANVAVVISSGYNEQDLVDRFAGKGLAGFIQKPYKTAKLSEVLEFVFQKVDGKV